jgi:hypothetical protein
VTGLEHYRAAEGLLAQAREADGEGYSADRDAGRHDRCLLEAQVHATLALAASTNAVAERGLLAGDAR